MRQLYSAEYSQPQCYEFPAVYLLFIMAYQADLSSMTLSLDKIKDIESHVECVVLYCHNGIQSIILLF